jgi:hypothetical protein
MNTGVSQAAAAPEMADPDDELWLDPLSAALPQGGDRRPIDAQSGHMLA